MSDCGGQGYELHCKKDQGFEISALHSAWEVRDDFISTSSLKVFQEEKWIFISIKEERKNVFQQNTT